MWTGSWLKQPAAAAAAAAADVSFDALVVEVRSRDQRSVRFQVAVRGQRVECDAGYVLEPYALVDVTQWTDNGAAAAAAAATTGDLVRVEGFTVVPNKTRPGAFYYNCRGVRVLHRAAKLAADDAFLGAQPALAPDVMLLIPSRIVHCVADPLNPQPGMMSRVDWPSTAATRAGDKPVLSFTVTLVQWQAQQVADGAEEPAPQQYQADLWDCSAFVAGHAPPVDTWMALFPVNQVPFVMLCSRQQQQQQLQSGRFLPHLPKLKVHCVSVQLRDYLKQKCPRVSVDLVRTYVTTTAASTAHLLLLDGVLNVSAAGVPHNANRWIYYAMTSDPDALQTEAKLQAALQDCAVEAVLWFAMENDGSSRKKIVLPTKRPKTTTE